MKKINAEKLEAKRLDDSGSLPKPIERGPQSYPKYKDYHVGDIEDEHRNKY